jgi:beta-carotene/zeaxanthin 4-ketolase
MAGRPAANLAQGAAFETSSQQRTGLTLAAMIIAAWLTLHVLSVFTFDLTWRSSPLAFVIVLVQTWLSVGLFIVAHDCMHGALVPFKPWANRWIGRVCLFLYAGFSFETLNKAHHLHHRYAGTGRDPDFDDRKPQGFWRWFAKFFLEYFSWTQIALISGFVLLFLALGASSLNMVVFWAVPGLLSALQLFTFGTYLPHRPDILPFADRHNARSQGFPVWLSLLTCFHFGYHHEHHEHPAVPWWRLPKLRLKNQRAGNSEPV